MEAASFSASRSMGRQVHSCLCRPVNGQLTVKETLTCLSDTRKMKHSTLTSMSARYA